ncbi:MAG: helix-hairpin-helix domain-containing protein [Planctomycetota bacterium]
MHSHPGAHSPSRLLQELPNVGPSVAGDLLRLGIQAPSQLKGRDPFRMYEQLCRKDGVRHDPCLIDVFISITEIAKGRPAQPWWHFTSQRKAAMLKRGSASKR